MSTRHVGMDIIIDAVSAATGVARRDILSDRRPAEVCEARFAVVWLASELMPLTMAAIGRLLGDRDATTMLHALRRAQELRTLHPEFRIGTDTLLATLTALTRAGVDRLAAAADPVATAQRVLAAPDREAVRLPVADIIALCRFVADSAEPPPTTSPVMENSDAE